LWYATDFEYNGEGLNAFELVLGFKRAVGSGHSMVKFTLMRGDDIATVREDTMEKDEKFIKIGFYARPGDDISLKVENCTDTTDMVVTYSSPALVELSQ
jgi:hypothetical protein